VVTIGTNSATAFQIQNASGTNIFVVDTTNLTITLGSASASPVILIIGIKNTAGDPTCINGGMYYNSNTSQFRGCANGAYNNIGGNNVVTTIPTTNLYEGRTVQLRVGSSPYTFLTMTYDATYGKWVSNTSTPLVIGATRGGNGAVSGASTYTNLFGTGFVNTPILDERFYDMWQAGLRPQFKYSYSAQPNTNGVGMKFREEYDYNDGPSGNLTTDVTGLDSETSGTTPAYFVVNTDWEQPALSTPVSGRRLSIQPYGFNVGTPTANNYLLSMTAWVRWVSQ
jgi:hypothetical protein